MRFLSFLLLLLMAGQALADHDHLSDKTLIVGSELDFPPFALGNSEETASGFTVELWKAVAAESKLKYTLRVKPFNQLLKDFKTGKIDVLLNLAQSPERHKFADFTVPTAIISGAIFVRKNEIGVRSEADLSGKSIIVLNADLAHDYAIAQGWQKQLVLVQDAEEGLQLLASGKHDAMLLSKLVGLKIIDKLDIGNVKALRSNTGFAQKFAFAVHKYESALLASINEGLALTKSSGVFDRLYDKWFAVYEEEEILDRTLLNFLWPILLIAALVFAYLYYKWITIRQLNLRQNLENQLRIQLALEGADLGLWDWNVITEELFINERWKEMLGYQNDMIAPHISSWQILVHPDDWQVINPALNGYLKGKIPKFECEYRLLHKEGHWIWVLDRGKVVKKSPDGKPLRMVGTHLDITERKEKQTALETLLAGQQAMLNNEMIGIAKAKDCHFAWTNSTLNKLLGYDPNDLIGLPTSCLFPSNEAYQAFSVKCEPVLNSNKTYRAQVEQIRKDGSLIWVDLSCSILDPDKHEGIIVIIDVTEKKRSEEAKLEALKRIKQISDQLPGFVYQFCLRPDGSSYFPYASEQIKSIYRLSPEDVREDASIVYSMLHPDDYSAVSDSILVSAQNLSPWQQEYRVQFNDGTVRWLFGNSFPCQLDDGSVLWHGFITDITERKRIEVLLRESESRNALILNCAELGTWDWNIKTGHVIFNEQWARMRGYRLDEIELHVSEWEKHIHPDDYPGVKTQLSKYIHTREDYFQAEYRVQTRSGQWIWVLDRGAIIENDAEGNPARMAGTEMDITLRKNAEENLLASSHRLHLALQGANDGLWDWNYETDEVYLSPRWKSMLGYEDNELPNVLETWSKLVDPADRDSVYQGARKHVEGKLPKFEVEFRMRHKHGHWVDILSRGKLAVDRNGKKLVPLRMIGTHVDISERKHQEQQRLAQETALRDLLVKEVHHRIKNNIQGIAGILRQHAEIHTETLVPINQAISQLKSIGVVYGLQGQDSMSRVRLHDLVTSIIKAAELIWNRPILLDMLPGTPLYFINENETVPLALVLNELILNAVKHSGLPEHVKVILSASHSDEAVNVSIHNNGHLSPDFDFYRERRQTTGLNLVASLLPREGAILSHEQQGATVVTLLECQAPLIYFEQPSEIPEESDFDNNTR